MKKAIYTLAILSSIFISCNGDLKDDIDDLETSLSETQASLSETQASLSETEAENEALQSELDELSEELDDSAAGFFKPISTTHEYSYDTDNPITEEFDFFGTDDNEIFLYDYDDGTYYFYIYIYNGNDYAEIGFDYDSSTGIADDDFYYDYALSENIYGDYVYMYGYDGQSYNDTSITVNSFDTSTGEISITLVSEYTADYSYSEYDTAGTLTMTFDGTAKVILEEPTSSVTVTATDR